MGYHRLKIRCAELRIIPIGPIYPVKENRKGHGKHVNHGISSKKHDQKSNAEIVEILGMAPTDRVVDLERKLFVLAVADRNGSPDQAPHGLAIGNRPRGRALQWRRAACRSVLFRLYRQKRQTGSFKTAPLLLSRDAGTRTPHPFTSASLVAESTVLPILLAAAADLRLVARGAFTHGDGLAH